MSDKINIVYLYGYSPNDSFHMETLVPLIKNQTMKDLRISVVLIHDGVIAASSNKKINHGFKELIELPIELYVMVPDLKARGIKLESVKNTIKPIEYGNLVDILDSAEKLISWM